MTYDDNVKEDWMTDRDECDNCGRVRELYHNEASGLAYCEECDMKSEQGTIRVLIGAYGCDDCTEWVQEVTQKEYEFLKAIADKSQKLSTYDCMATFKVAREILDDEGI